MTDCPCGGGAYRDCCEPLHDGVRQAQTAEQLMRSRYSAYALDRLDHIFRTWHPRTRPAEIESSAIRWRSLHIGDVQDGGSDDDTGEVTFTAVFEQDGEPGELRERSRFVRRSGRWVYLDGVLG